MIHFRRQTVLALTALLGLAASTGCANDLTDPQSDDVSPAARQTAIERTHELLTSTEVARTASTVQDLTGGFAVGLADEAVGLDMELGEGFALPPASVAELGVGATIHRGVRTHDRAAREFTTSSVARRAPGDLIARFTETNFDGSVSQISIYEGEFPHEVRIERLTTWPQGNLLLTAIEDEIVVDLGDDLLSAADDVWQSLSSEIRFNGGASLARAVDLREQGGFVDGVRASIVSTWRPRPNHPVLVDVTSTLVVDLHRIASEADDRFVSIDRLTRFAGTAHDGQSPRVLEALVLEQPVAEGERPCGGTLNRQIHFRRDRALRSWTDGASWACGGGGTLSRAIVHADGGVDAITLTDAGDGVVRLDAEGRDGTITVGSFEHDAHVFEFTTTYPDGADPVERSVQGSTDPEATAWQLDEQVTYLDAFVERNHLEASETAQGRSLAGSHTGREETVRFELTSTPDDTRMAGWVENDRDQRIEFEIEQFTDGGALIDFVATEPGLRVEGHLEADPTGCGNGTLTITEADATVTLEVSFCHGELENDEAILAGN